MYCADGGVARGTRVFRPTRAEVARSPAAGTVAVRGAIAIEKRRDDAI